MLFDSARLSSRRAAPGGGLLVEARIARSGVQVYRRSDGSSLRVYRSPDTIAACDYTGTPVTVQHPAGPVTTDTRASVSCGVVMKRTGLTRVGSHLYDQYSLLITDVTVAAAVDASELVECSCGYDADRVDLPGVSPEGEAYDAEFRKVRPNHVALLHEGQARAGLEARILDANTHTEDIMSNTMYIIDSDDAQLSTPEVAPDVAPDVVPAVASVVAPLVAPEVAPAVAPAVDLKARAEAAEAALATAQAKLAAADTRVADALVAAIQVLDSTFTVPGTGADGYLEGYLAAARKLAPREPPKYDYNAALSAAAAQDSADPLDVQARIRAISAQAYSGGAK